MIKKGSQDDARLRDTRQDSQRYEICAVFFIVPTMNKGKNPRVGSWKWAINMLPVFIGRSKKKV